MAVLPMPTSLSMRMVPPSLSHSSLQMDRPRPVPPCRRVVEASAWVKLSKMVSSLSCAIPVPQSRTENCTMTRSSQPKAHDVSTVTCRNTDPWSVNLTPLPSRLIRIWRNRCGSPSRTRGTSAAMA